MPVAHPVAVKLNPEVHARVRELAKAQHRSPHYLMREAITQYVEREEKREAFRQEALAAWGDKVQWADQLPERFEGVVVGNEVLDAMPVELMFVPAVQLEVVALVPARPPPSKAR